MTLRQGLLLFAVAYFRLAGLWAPRESPVSASISDPVVCDCKWTQGIQYWVLTIEMESFNHQNISPGSNKHLFNLFQVTNILYHYICFSVSLNNFLSGCKYFPFPTPSIKSLIIWLRLLCYHLHYFHHTWADSFTIKMHTYARCGTGFQYQHWGGRGRIVHWRTV